MSGAGFPRAGPVPAGPCCVYIVELVLLFCENFWRWMRLTAVPGRCGGPGLGLFQKFQSVSLDSSAGWDVRTSRSLSTALNISILTD